jgi:hypothetical protein
VYWLRARGKPFQYSLRALFGLTTVVACYLGILKFYAPDSLRLGSVLEVILLLLPWLLLYAVPAGLVITAAHWTVVRSTDSARRCRWLGFHWLSWLAVAAVGGPFFHYSLMADTGIVDVESPAPASLVAVGSATVLRAVVACGWPLKYSSLDSSVRYFAPFALTADTLVWLTAMVAMGFVVERWVRRVEQRISMRPTAFLSAIFVAYVVICVLLNDPSSRPDWYDYPSWLLGIAATVYAAELLIVNVFLRHLNVVAKVSLIAGLCVGVAFWTGLSRPLSLAAGSVAAAAVDGVYRLLSHPDRGVSRFVRRDCGGCVAAAPMWIVAMVGVITVLALVYSQF